MMSTLMLTELVVCVQCDYLQTTYISDIVRKKLVCIKKNFSLIAPKKFLSIFHRSLQVEVLSTLKNKLFLPDPQRIPVQLCISSVLFSRKFASRRFWKSGCQFLSGKQF